MSKKQPPKKLVGVDSRTKLHGQTTIQTEGNEGNHSSMPEI